MVAMMDARNSQYTITDDERLSDERLLTEYRETGHRELFEE